MAMADSKPVTGIREVSVKGFKSLAKQVVIKIRPLTILAGANSSGKSSAMQPLLLLKQTLEASYDPGPLLLDGPHVRFTSAEQLLSRVDGQRAAREFEVGISLEQPAGLLKLLFRQDGEGFELVRMSGSPKFSMELGVSTEKLLEMFPPLAWTNEAVEGLQWKVVRERCFLFADSYRDGKLFWRVPFTNFSEVTHNLRLIIHVPGLRGNPVRSYPTTAIGESFSGPFDPYAASVIASWQRSHDERLEILGEDLRRLGMTWGVRAQSVDATQVELLVGRLPKRGRKALEDLVNIADVGFGVSQVLPVLVALLVAGPGQLVYLEQPEIHLHPRAQEGLASLLMEAAARGARVVLETHSSLLLLAVQSLVAQEKLSPKDVGLYWFERNKDGLTTIHPGDLDRLGAYGDWPEDFGAVSLEAEHKYLSAVEARAFRPIRDAKR
jgi:hypothetical protein